MITFKSCVRNRRKDGFWIVYIRVTNKKKSVYMRTGKVVNDSGIGKNGEIVDPFVAKYCADQIVNFIDMVNKAPGCSLWSVNDIVEYLKSGFDDVSFSKFGRKYIDKMINDGHERNAKNYRLALNHLERFMGTNEIMCSRLTSRLISKWIDSMRLTHRAKEMYPICIRQMFKAAQIEYNDYDNGILRIKTNPWARVKIPMAERTEKLAITPEECREFFGFPLPESKMKEPLMELGRDVAMMMLCLAGMNTVDIYKLKKVDYHGGIIHYHRSKTMNFRDDNAYMEMRVPPILYPIFDKYKDDDKDDEHLFNFHRRMSTFDSFCANVNVGIRQICKAMGIPKERDYSAYTFRHTWGTVAQNDCGATISEVAFAMNHASAHKVTMGYIKVDYHPAWVLNEKVVDFIFFSDRPSAKTAEEKEPQFRLSFRFLARGTAWLGGRLLAKVEDTGYNNVNEVIRDLVKQLPPDIPDRCIVLFKIENLDKNETVVYQKMKGKGF